MHKIKSDVQSGKIPSIIADSGNTSHCRNKNDPFVHMGEPSPKVFHMSLRLTTKEMHKAKLIHQVKEPARTVHIIPGLQNSSLFSIGKFANTNYITIFTPNKVQLFDGDNTKIASTSKPTL